MESTVLGFDVVKSEDAETAETAVVGKELFYWTGWQRRHWPLDVIRPEFIFYGFDKRIHHRTVFAKMQIRYGGSFEYRNRREFERRVKSLTRWYPSQTDHHMYRIPRKGFGIALRYSVVKRINIRMDGKVPQIGWLRLPYSTVSKAGSNSHLSANVDPKQVYEEGERLLRIHQHLERNSRLRNDSLKYWLSKQRKLRCIACKLCFEEVYGPLGSGFIEMHHTQPMAKLSSRPKLQVTDLVPLCANCHRMIHRGPNGVLTVEQLRRVLK